MQQHSSATALLYIANEICNSRNSNRDNVLGVAGLYKAFDTIDHKIMCNKLKYVGMDTNSVLTVESVIVIRW